LVRQALANHARYTQAELERSSELSLYQNYIVKSLALQGGSLPVRWENLLVSWRVFWPAYLPSLENTLASSRRPHRKTTSETQAFLWKAVLFHVYVEMKNQLKK